MKLRELFTNYRWLLILALLAAIIPNLFLIYNEYFGSYSAVVATSPAGADLYLDGNALGRAPVTLHLKRGVYTVEARRPGFEPVQQAFYVSYKAPPIVNLQMPQLSTQPKIAEPASTSDDPARVPKTTLIALAEDVARLKAAVIAHPEEALSLALLREKMLLQETLSAAIREDLKELKEQGRWFMGSMLAVIAGLLGVVVTLFVAPRGK